MLHNESFFSVKNDENWLYQNGERCVQITDFEELRTLFSLSNEQIIIRDDRNRAVVYNLQTKTIAPFLAFQKRCLEVYKGYIIFYDRELETHGIYDYKEDKIIAESQEMGSIWFDNFVIKNIKKGFTFSIFPHLMNLWEFSTENFPPYRNAFWQMQAMDIKKILGVYNDLLWVRLGNYQLIALDIADGKMVHQIEVFEKAEEALQRVFLDTQKGIIKMFVSNFYQAFDLNSLSLRKNIEICLDKNVGVHASNFYENDDNLYFCAEYGTTFPNSFGIFDTQLGEITWIQQMVMDGTGNAMFFPPQANEHFLAILDNKKVLHVYQK